MLPFRRFLPLICAVLFVLPSLLRAETELPSYLSKHPATPSPLDKDFDQWLEKIRLKTESGEHSEAAFAPELKEFDELMAKYDDKTSDKIAFLATMKASLYIDVFQNPVKGIELLRKIKADYAKTKVVAKIDALITQAEGRPAPMDDASVIGGKIEPFSLDDLYGEPFSLNDYKGRIVLIYFWATSNDTCVRELPGLMATYAKYHAKGFEIVGVSLDDDRVDLTNFIRKNHMTWRQFFDGRGMKSRLALGYGVDKIPTTFLVDGQGIVLARNLRLEGLDAKLAELLK